MSAYTRQEPAVRAREIRNRRRRRPELLLTPLIDIIFLLVVFFIINTSFRQERYIDVDLPAAETSQDIQSTGITLTLRADGTVAVEGEEISWESVVSAISAAAEKTGASEVIVRGDEDIPYGRAVEAIDRIRLAGLEAVSLQTVRLAE